MLWIGIVLMLIRIGIQIRLPIFEADLDPTRSFTNVGKNIDFYSQQCKSYIFLVSVLGVLLFIFWTAYLNILEKCAI